MAENGDQGTSLVFPDDVSVSGDSSRPSSIIFFFICFLPVFTTLLFGGVDATTWIFISIIWAAIILLWVTDAWDREGLLFNPSPLYVPLLGLIAIGLVQIIPLGTSGVTGVEVSQTLSMDPFATRMFTARMIILLVFFAGCMTFINNHKRLARVANGIVIFGAFIAFFGILQRLANPDGIYGIRETPQAIPFGPFVNQHHFAALMQMTSGVTLGLLMGRDTSRDRKILYAISLVIMAAAALLTSSRGGLLGMMSVVIFIVLTQFFLGRWSKRKHLELSQSSQGKLAAAAGLVVLIFVVVGLVIFLGGDESLLRGIGAGNMGGDFTTGRAHFWPIAISLFLQHPIIGAGFDAFGVAFTGLDTWSGYLRVEQAHNEYLQILADSGIAGAVCIIAFILLLFRRAFVTISEATGPMRDAAVGALGGCFGILVHSFFDFPLRTYSNSFFFLLLCAVATNGIRARGRHRSRH